MRLFEWQNVSFAAHQAQLPGFINYLATAWQNRARYQEAEDEPSEEEQKEQELQRQRFFDFSIDGKISARNYVGVVQYEGIRVEVYPKIFSGNATATPKQWQLNLLYWLSYCRKIRFPFALADVSKLPFDDYLELLIYIFSNYTAEIIAQQPFQAYQTVEEETSFLRGRLSFDNYTKHNLITGKWQNLYCTYEPFVYDNLFNRIVKYVTRRLSAISENHINKGKLNEILFMLDDVTDLRCTAADCNKVQLNPLYEDHQHILELCRLFLSNQVIDMEAEDSRNFCFMVPMEYVFEEFVFGFISEKWPSLQVAGQSTTFLATNGDVKVFQIRNDMYINRQLIIDTKYKIRKKGDGVKAGVSQGDLYQMLSYAVSRNCKDVLLLYPKAPEAFDTPTQFQIPSDMLPAPVNVHVSTIDISFEQLQEADEVIKERIKALNMLFGDSTIKGLGSQPIPLPAI